MFKLNFQQLSQDTLISLQRFPLAALSSLLLTMFWVEPTLWPSRWNQEALSAIFILGFFWFISIKLFAESRKWNNWITMGVSVVIFGLIAIYFYKLSVLIYPFILLSIGLALLVLIVPFLKRSTKQENIWVYNYQLWSHIFFSGIAALVLGIGLSFLLISLDYLFHFKLFYDQYYKLMIVIGGFFLPMFVMTGIPSRFDVKVTVQQGRGIQLLLDYVMTPILFVFGFIIISYAIKILVLQNLPRGKVVYLVSILGFFGSLSYVLGDRHSKSLSKVHQLFRKYFFHLMIIPLILMGMGFGVRVLQYGLTAPRYAVALLLLWLSLCTVYSFVCNRERLSRFMFASAAGLCIFGSFGPWGIVDLSNSSQIYRLQALLEKNHILVNKTIQKNHPPISSQDEQEIRSTLYYIILQGRGRDLQSWFGPNSQALFNVPNPKLIQSTNLLEEMGIKFTATGGPENTFNFILHDKWEGWKAIGGYDYVFQNLQILGYHENGLEPNQSANEIILDPCQNVKLIVRFEAGVQNLIIKQKHARHPILTVNIADVVRKLQSESVKPAIDKDLIFEGSDDNIKVRLSIDALSGYVGEDGISYISGIRGDLYMKKLDKPLHEKISSKL